LLTSESIRNHGLRNGGIVLNHADGANDLAQTTNANELRRLLPDIPLLPIAETGSESTLNLAGLFTESSHPSVFNKLTQM
jgi:hypothetical protein